jgi:hypothetical protein
VVTAYSGASYAPGNLSLWQFIPREATVQLGGSLLRASLPRWQSIEGGSSGWGDAQLFYLVPKRVRNGRFGGGLSMWIPVASNPNLGTGKWSIGPSVGYGGVNPASRMFIGFLVQSFFSVAGPSWRQAQSLILFQPIMIKE